MFDIEKMKAHAEAIREAYSNTKSEDIAAIVQAIEAIRPYVDVMSVVADPSPDGGYRCSMDDGDYVELMPTGNARVGIVVTAGERKGASTYADLASAALDGGWSPDRVIADIDSDVESVLAIDPSVAARMIREKGGHNV